MNPKKIKTGEPFESLFPVDAHTLDAIAKDMELHGYDDAHHCVGRVVSILPALLVHLALDGDGQGQRVRAREGVP